MGKSNEELLFVAIKSKNKDKINEIFEKIYNDYVKLVAFSVGKYVKDVDDIKDITNEVFIRFFKNIENIKTSIKYYLLSTARNLSIDYLKEKNKYEVFENIDDLINENLIESYNGYQELVDDLKNVLSLREVEIIILHVVDGYTFKEIGAKLNLSSKNANKIYERALKKFKASIK